MIRITLSRKITNAADRSKDAVVKKACRLPAVPRCGDLVSIDSISLHVEVEAVEFFPDEDCVCVILKPDHRGFKASNAAEYFDKTMDLYRGNGWVIPGGKPRKKAKRTT